MVNAVIIIVAALFFVVALLVGGYFGYREYQKRSTITTKSKTVPPVVHGGATADPPSTSVTKKEVQGTKSSITHGNTYKIRSNVGNKGYLTTCRPFENSEVVITDSGSEFLARINGGSPGQVLQAGNELTFIDVSTGLNLIFLPVCLQITPPSGGVISCITIGQQTSVTEGNVKLVVLSDPNGPPTQNEPIAIEVSGNKVVNTGLDGTCGGQSPGVLPLSSSLPAGEQWIIEAISSKAS